MNYYNYCVSVNTKSNGEHEVHKVGCSYFPYYMDRISLGTFLNCREAVLEAKKTYKTANGCYYCSKECHS